MINPYSFTPYGRNSSAMSNSNFGQQKKPSSFGEYVMRLATRCYLLIRRGFSMSKRILWGASIGKPSLTKASIFILLPLVLADMVENMADTEAMMKAYQA